MQEVPEIDAETAKTHLDAGDALFVDIRDPQSYAVARIPGAIRVDDGNVAEFLKDTPKDGKVIVCCYHGNNSKDATLYFQEQGFSDVHSLRGGFADWRGHRYDFESGLPKPASD